MSFLAAITERIARNGDVNALAMPRPLLTLAEFFDGNQDVGGIGCNLVPIPTPAESYEILKRIAGRPDVADMRVQITMFDDPERWPFSDTVWIVTSADAAHVAQWFDPAVRPDATWNGWTPDATFESYPVPNGMHPSLAGGIEEDKAMPSPTSSAAATHRGKRQNTSPGEELFYHQLSAAQDALNEIGVVLQALSSRLEAAASGEEVDATPAVDRARELIWSYDNAVETARDAWLRYDLSPSLNQQSLSLDTPAIYGLPWFLDEAQERRAMLQGVEISRRLMGRNELVDRIMAAADVVPLSASVAGVGLGGGSYVEIRRRNGRWSLVKTVANSAPQSTGKEKQRPCDVSLAAALVRFMLRKQLAGTRSN